MKAITVKQMREFLSNAPDDMLLGVEDHYGEFLPLATDISELRIKDTYADTYVRVGKGVSEKSRTHFRACILPAIDIGPEPE